MLRTVAEPVQFQEELGSSSTTRKYQFDKGSSGSQVAASCNAKNLMGRYLYCKEGTANGDGDDCPESELETHKQPIFGTTWLEPKWLRRG